MKVLVIKNDGIGDLILVSGLLSDLAKHFGSIDLLTCIENREIAENINGIGARHYISRDAISVNVTLLKIGVYLPGVPKDDRKTIEVINAIKYDIVICLRRYIRQSSLVLLNEIKAARRLACWMWSTNIHRKEAANLSASIEWYFGDLASHSELEYFRSWIQRVFGFESKSEPRVFNECLERQTVNNDLVGICLSGWFKNWSEENWVEISQRLLGQGKSLVLFGGQDAKGKAGRIAALSPKVNNQVGKLSFQESIPFVRSCNIVISNDTGFAHFASLYAKDILIILGGGTFDHFFPWPKAPNQYIIYNGLECFGCNWICRFSEMKCFTGILVDQVLEFFEKIQSGNGENIRNVGENVPMMGHPNRLCQTNQG